MTMVIIGGVVLIMGEAVIEAVIDPKVEVAVLMVLVLRLLT